MRDALEITDADREAAKEIVKQHCECAASELGECGGSAYKCFMENTIENYASIIASVMQPERERAARMEKLLINLYPVCISERTAHGRQSLWAEISETIRDLVGEDTLGEPSQSRSPWCDVNKCEQCTAGTREGCRGPKGA